MRAEGTEFRTGANVGDDVDVDALRAEFDAVVLAGGATAWRDLPDPGPRADAASIRRWSTCRCRTGCRKATCAEPTDHRRGQARGDHRRRRHRRRLPRHRAPPGRGLGAPVRDPAAPAGDAGADTIRGRRTPMSSACRRRTRRAASASTASTPSASSATTRATCARCARTRSKFVDGKFEKIEGTDFELPCELVLLAMGFLGPERAGMLEQLGVELDPRGNVARDERVHDQRRRASSRAATWAAVRA